MSRKADIPPKIGPLPDWLLPADNSLKIGPPEWLPLDPDAYRRMRDRLGSGELAKRDLHAALCSKLPSAVRLINSNGKQIFYLLHPRFWKQQGYLWVETDAADHLGIYYRDRSRSFDGRAYFFVQADVFERLCPTTAASASAPSPNKEPKRALRRRQTKHDWDEICAEIGALCHDQSGRVYVPANQSELVDKVLLFCQNELGCDPAPSEIHKTVQVICARFRKIIPGKR